MIFFTSDHHFNHKNIIEYSKRPFSSLEEMNETLIERWNHIVNPGDLVYYLGDFAMGQPHEWVNFMNRLNGDVILIKGNHDNVSYYRTMEKVIGIHNNKTYITKNGYNILLCHYPPDYSKNPLGKYYDIALCGHIHQAWKYKEIDGKPCLNVGVDVHGFEPISINRVLIECGLDGEE